MLPQRNKLNPIKFKSVLNQGMKIRGEYGMLVVLRSNESSFKIGFIVSKKIGNAVARNRMTRLLREIIKKNLSELSNNIEAVYVAYKYCNNYEQLQKDLDKQIQTIISSTKKN